jgi:flagellin
MASFGDYNRVNTNVTAMDAQLSLNKINRDLGESRLRLSTGFKINNAEDDAAGFAIATKLKSRVAGLEQALQNVSEAKSVLDIVEGAYGSIMDNLIEMKTLATHGANSTLGQNERDYIGEGIEALADNINDVVESTRFNNINLLDGNGANDNTIVPAGNFTLSVQSGENANEITNINIDFLNTGQLFGFVTNNRVLHPNVGGAAITTAQDTQAGADSNTEPTRTSISVDPGVTGAMYSDFIGSIDGAINVLNSDINTLGINQKSLSNKEQQLTQAITANNAAKSRIMDTDFAKEQSNSIRLQILQQTATAALSQANMGPQAVLGFLGQ